MNEFFFELVKSNWGITFHYIFSLWFILVGYILWGRKGRAYVIAGTFTFGGLYEFYQAIFEGAGGQGTIEDMLANILGIGMAVVFAEFLIDRTE